MQILHTVFGPFLRQEQGEFVQQSVKNSFSCWRFPFILMTQMLYSGVKLCEEITCYSLVGVKRLKLQNDQIPPKSDTESDMQWNPNELWEECLGIAIYSFIFGFKLKDLAHPWHI